LAEIRNPNQPGGGGQDSRTLLMFSAVFILIFLGLQYFGPKKPAAPAQPAPSAVGAGTGAAAYPAAPPPAPGSQPAGGESASAESTTVVENALYRIVFSNRGGQAVSWILKKYKNDSGLGSLDLVNRKAAARFGYPLSLWTEDKTLRDRLAGALFVASSTGQLTAPGELRFTYASGGLAVTKTLSFDSSYVVHVAVTATDNGAPLPVWVSWPAGLGDQQTTPDFAQGEIDAMEGDKGVSFAAKKISDGAPLNGAFQWAGLGDLYFTAVFLPDSPGQLQLIGLHHLMDVPRHPDRPDPVDSVPVLGAAMGSSSGRASMRLFAGPKDIDVLTSVRASADNGALTGPSLESAVNFGYLTVIAKPLFLILRWVHEHIVSNWGWAILVLTLVINLAMLPTRIQMMKSALKMQRIQPEMNAIKEKYKKYKANDPRRAEMNQEMFALQKREGVNMFGGCLPMLIQWPLLYGFYRMLMHTIELRQAPWLWLHNLAAPDPLHILPIFFIVTMFLVQYLTPSPGMDPAQQKMMALTMPVFFGFMTWNLSSGLALYWAFGNVINVIQQMFMNRTRLGRQMREVAQKRAAKRLGRR
jgi:YidC/Oxa1 family membrane protein insertase